MVVQKTEFCTYQEKDFEIQRGMPSADVLEERLRFVKAMHWLPEEVDDDMDRYDTCNGTYHFTRRNESGSVIAAMRLTPVESIEASLTYEMMAANSELQRAARDGEEMLVGSDIWDLTRLISPLHKQQGAEMAQEAVVELFGMAAYTSIGSPEGGGKRVCWIFSTTPPLIRFFSHLGIEATVIAEGKLSNVDGAPRQTLFCAVDVGAVIESLEANKEHQRTFIYLKNGIVKAETGERSA